MVNDVLLNLNASKEICNNLCSMLTSVRRPCDLGYSIWSCSIIWNKNELFQHMYPVNLHSIYIRKCLYYQPGLNWILTPASF